MVGALGTQGIWTSSIFAIGAGPTVETVPDVVASDNVAGLLTRGVVN